MALTPELVDDLLHDAAAIGVIAAGVPGFDFFAIGAEVEATLRQRGLTREAAATAAAAFVRCSAEIAAGIAAAAGANLTIRLQ
jgi:hypothetical protein